MKKLFKALLIILLVLAVAAGGLYVWQKDLIDAWLLARKYTKEDINYQLDEAEKNIENIVEEITSELLDPPADKGQQASSGGNSGQAPSENQQQGGQQSGKTPQGQEQTAPDPDKERIAEIVGSFQGMRTEYENAIEGLKSEAISEYKAAQGSGAKADVVSRYIKKANDMEKEADSRVDSLIAELRDLLKKTGGDTAVADKIVETYASVKNLTKAYYMNQLKENGLI